MALDASEPAANKDSKTSPPQRLMGGRYLIERILGRGGAGVVYLAKDSHLKEQRVALKVVEVQETQFHFLSASLKNEFSTLTHLRHRNLAPVYDYGSTEREIYFSSEWIDGQDIMRATHKANLNTVFQLLVQTLRAVDFLHRRGVLHLDLKPENILVTDPDRTGDLCVKIIDFGMAQWKRKLQFGPKEFSGTPPYTAPEIRLKLPPTPASDIYSLGILFHQILVKRLPFRNQNVSQIMQEQLEEDPLRMEKLNAALPDDFSEVLLKMVAKNPSDRYQSAQDLLEAINQSLKENFSLRTPTAPIRILEESEAFFRPELLTTLTQVFSEPKPQVIIISGPEGVGKSHLVRRLKETLQLKEIFPLVLSDFPTQEDLRKIALSPLSTPLFIELSTENQNDFNSFLPKLEETKMQVLFTTRQNHFSGTKRNQVIELKPLADEQILAFLQNEVVDFPLATHGLNLAQSSGGLPHRLEILLQEMREEGRIQWGHRGWHWTGSTSEALGDLFKAYEARWKERYLRIRDILKFSRSGLDARVLEGIVGLEKGALDEKLKVWIRQGLLRHKVTEGGELYFSPTIEGADAPVERTVEWTWLGQELERLYESDEFERGTQWAHWVNSHFSNQNLIPEKLRVLCARHFLALGFAEQALQILPDPYPEDLKLRGLSIEIRARARITLGDFSNFENDLEEARICYSSMGDQAGLARLLIAWGTYHKKIPDFKSAAHSFQQAMQEAEKGKNVYIQTLALMNLGTVYHDQGQLERAHAAYQDAFLHEKQIGHPMFSCILRHNWVNLLFHMGQAVEAELACYEWLRLAIQHRYIEQQAAVFNYLALLSGQNNHREKQLHYLNQAVGLLNARPSSPRLFQTLVNRGYLYCDLKLFIPAQLDAEAALDLAHRDSSTSLLLWVYLLLGKVYRDRPKPDYESAFDFFEKALQVNEESNNRQLLWEIHFERGLLAKKKKEIAQARECFLAAQRELESLLGEIPEHLKASYFRDRKLEKILSELKN